jgi:hypothetical protein
MQKEIDGMVYNHDIDKWLAIEDYNDMVAEELQKKIAEDLYLYETKEFDKWLENLAETNGVTNY